MKRSEIEEKEFTERVKIRKELLQFTQERNWIPNASTATHWLINEIARLRLRIQYLESEAAKKPNA